MGNPTLRPRNVTHMVGTDSNTLNAFPSNDDPTKLFLAVTDKSQKDSEGDPVVAAMYLDSIDVLDLIHSLKEQYVYLRGYELDREVEIDS